MQHLQSKFQEQYNCSKILNIYFLDENPFSIRRVRYTKNGVACYCSINETQGKENPIKNGLTKIAQKIVSIGLHQKGKSLNVQLKVH